MVKEKGRCIKWIVFTLAVIIAGFPASYGGADTSGQNPTIVLDVEPTTYRYGQDITLIILDPDFGEIVEDSKNYMPAENFKGIEKSYTCQGLATVKWDIKAKNGHIIDTVEELIMTDKLTITMIVPTPTSAPTATPVPTATPKPTAKPTPCYQLTVSVDPGEGGTISVSPNQNCYPENSSVYISVNLSKNYLVRGWIGTSCEEKKSCKISMNKNKDVTVSLYLNKCGNLKKELAELKKKKAATEKEKQRREKLLTSANNLIKMHKDAIDAILLIKGALSVVNCGSTAYSVVTMGAAAILKTFFIEVGKIACSTAGEIIYVNVADINDKIDKLNTNIESYEKQIEQNKNIISDLWIKIGIIKENINSVLLEMEARECD